MDMILVKAKQWIRDRRNLKLVDYICSSTINVYAPVICNSVVHKTNYVENYEIMLTHTPHEIKP